MLPWGTVQSRPRDQTLISAIRLQTSQPIAKMKSFYAQSIGFEVVKESESSITFRTGTGTLTFQHVPGVDAFYHFAFNIPENQILKAHAWQSNRTEFILPPAHLNDADMPRAIVAFRHWNAHSVFFWDPAGNAVEYIARHGLKNSVADDVDFSVKSVLTLSEIGLVVDDVPAAAGKLKSMLKLETYISASAAFEPIGDPHGLLLVMKRGARMAFDQGRQRDIYPTHITLARAPSKPVAVEGYPYTLDGAPERSR